MFRHAHTLSVPFRVFVQVVGKPQQAMKMETLFFVQKSSRGNCEFGKRLDERNAQHT